MASRYGLLVAVGLVVLASLAPPQRVSASCLAITRDSTFVDCRAVIAPPFMLGTVYVVAALFGDAAMDGVTGAEFKIEGFPAQWFPGATAHPAATATGDPLGSGCTIEFPECRNNIFATVLLYTILYLPTDGGVYNVNVVGATPPVDPQFDCPVMRLCDAPRTRLCVSGGFFRFNNIEPCEVAVEASSWGEIKALFHAP